MRWLRRMFVLLSLACIAFTASLWFLSDGLEEKVLSSIQPHLLTDVRIGAVEVTVWSSWPDVEVTLTDVHVEDALHPGEWFLELEELGVVFGWMPLLVGRLEVDRVQAREGRMRIERDRNGGENWRFWNAGPQEGSSLDWAIGGVGLEGVVVEGQWWAEGGEHPVEWSTLCHTMGLRRPAGVAGNGAMAMEGSARLEDMLLRADGRSWLEGPALDAGVRWSWNGGILEVEVERGILEGPSGDLALEGMLSGGADFAMRLGGQEADAATLIGVLPGFLLDGLDPDLKFGGKADVELLVGQGEWSPGRATPTDADWTGEWAVSMSPSTIQVGRKALSVGARKGHIGVYPVARGWKATVDGVEGDAAGGEYRCSGTWRSGRQSDVLDLDLEWTVRPARLMEVLEVASALPEGWTCKEGGAFSGKGQFGLRRSSGEWSWTGGSCLAELTDFGLGSAQGEFVVGSSKWDAVPGGVAVTFEGLKGPGLQGPAAGTVRGSEGNPLEVAVKADAVDVEALLGVLRGNGGASGSTVPGSMVWAVDLASVRWQNAVVRQLSARGQWDPASGQGTLEEVEAVLFEGRCSGRGEWSGKALEIRGRLADASIPQLLEGTEGLGQSTLLPSHVRGRLWAEGRLGYAFDAPQGLEWSTDLDVRVEQGELVDFGLLQRIPETLKEEPKYRFISDAQDLGQRLRRVRFEPVTTHVNLDMGLITLDQTQVVSDAMDVGIGGWQRLSGGMDYTLDFALRDLKSDQEEFGTTEDDGLGHRFFLAISGTLDAPEFGYDRLAHRAHRQDERRDAVERLRDLVRGDGGGERPVEGGAEPRQEGPAGPVQRGGEGGVSKPKPKLPDDDEDDFAP